MAESCDVGVAVIVVQGRAANRRAGCECESLTAENPISNPSRGALEWLRCAVWRHLDEKDGHDLSEDFVLCFVAGLKILGVTFRILHCGPFER